MKAFVHGLVLALGLILPLGVQNIFVFNQGVVQARWVRALPAVIAASVCDTLLILFSVQGVSLLLLKFAVFKIVLVVLGVVFLFYMGWLTWNSSPARSDGETGKEFSLKQQVGFAVAVSLCNPHAILDTVGVIGTSSVQYEGMEKALFTIACILVSWCWFFFLASAGRMAGGKAQFAKGLVWINKLSAVFMWGAACYMGYSSIPL
ncbi:MAG: Lysine exporter protein [Firmicutes bacterium]|nr:Lysine exporter protein [Bacillota bacterium]